MNALVHQLIAATRAKYGDLTHEQIARAWTEARAVIDADFVEAPQYREWPDFVECAEFVEGLNAITVNFGRAK